MARITEFAGILSLGIALMVMDSVAADSTEGVQPNILFLLADDLGWKDVGFHGSEIRTPHLDELAASGTRLEQFYVLPFCSPTRAAFLTGRYPIRYGMQLVYPWTQQGLALTERLLPQALQDAGYVTAIYGKWHLGHAAREYLPTSRGFVRQYGHYNGSIDYFTHLRSGGHDWNRDDKPLREEGYTTELIGREAARLIAEHDTTKPLFLYVPFGAPHAPLQAPERYLEQYASIKSRERRVFAAMVTSLDDAVGSILAALDKRGLRDETLVIFASDNGGSARYGASNGPLRSGKGTLYEGGVRVPALVSWPGVIDAGAIVSEPLHIVDLYPTLVTLAGGSLEQELPLDGVNAWATIARGEPSTRREILLHATPKRGAIRVGDWKLVMNGRDIEKSTLPEKPKLELFDLVNDPYEKNDLAEKHPNKRDELEKRLAKYAREAVKRNPAPRKPPAGFEAPKNWGHPD